MIDVACPQCKATYHADTSHIGKKLRCTSCGFLVPIVLDTISPAAPAEMVNRPPVKHQTPKRGRRHLAIIATVSAVGALALLLLRHPVATEQSTANHSESSRAQNKDDCTLTHYNSLPTGTQIEEDIGTDGHGKLTVENGTEEDAVVLLSGNGAERWFFVKAHSSAGTGKIPEGSYEVTFTTGLNWLGSEYTFGCDSAYGEFERPFVYSEQHDAEGVRYHDISVTLNPVPAGNIRTKSITREQFLRGHRQPARQATMR